MASKHPNNLAMYPFFVQPLLMRRVHQLRAIGEAVSISGSPEGLVSPTVSRIPMALSMTPSRFQGLKASKFQNLLLSPTSSRLAMNSLGLVLRPSRVLKWPRLGLIPSPSAVLLYSDAVFSGLKKVKHRTLAAPSLTSSVRCNPVWNEMSCWLWTWVKSFVQWKAKV